MNAIALAVALTLTGPLLLGPAIAQEHGGSEEEIYLGLLRPPNVTFPQGGRGFSIDEVINDRNLRHAAPGIDVRSINFEFGSAAIPPSEHWKIEPLAKAIHRFVWQNPRERFLLEGHTDAVGTHFANRELSQSRADALMRTLTQRFLVPQFAVIPVGFGASDPLVDAAGPESRNRRVVLRRITSLMFPTEQEYYGQRQFSAPAIEDPAAARPPIPGAKPLPPDADATARQKTDEGPFVDL